MTEFLLIMIVWIGLSCIIFRLKNKNVEILYILWSIGFIVFSYEVFSLIFKGNANAIIPVGVLLSAFIASASIMKSIASTKDENLRLKKEVMLRNKNYFAGLLNIIYPKTMSEYLTLSIQKVDEEELYGTQSMHRDNIEYLQNLSEELDSLSKTLTSPEVLNSFETDLIESTFILSMTITSLAQKLRLIRLKKEEILNTKDNLEVLIVMVNVNIDSLEVLSKSINNQIDRLFNKLNLT